MSHKLPIFRKGKTLSVSADECKFNTRIKFYPNEYGDLVPVEKMVVNDYIFNPHNVEYARNSNLPKVVNYDGAYISEYYEADNAERALRRAKAKLYDYIRCNLDLSYFLTLTISGEFLERENYEAVIKTTSQWLGNRVRRNGLKYVGVVERHHKSNGLHFHFMVNDSLQLVDSGTVKCKGRKRPIKCETADRYKIPLCDRKIVYNCPEWSYGFTTAIKITDDDNHIKTAHYLCKYLTKDFDKIGGRYYYSGGKLDKPVFRYLNDSFKDVDESYSFSVGGRNFKVFKFE